MSRFLHGFVHVAMVAANGAAVAKGFIPPEYSWVIPAAQGALALWAQKFNTDGTPQTVAFQPKQQEAAQ